MRYRPVVISESDAAKLRTLLFAYWHSDHDQEHLQELRQELERAAVVDTEEVPADVITLQTRVQVLEVSTGIRREFVLVLPTDADVSAGRISVLAPLGTALLGYREGDEVVWQMPGGVQRLRIEQVLQPAGRIPASARAAYRPAALG